MCNNYRDVIAMRNAFDALSQMGEEFTAKEYKKARRKYARSLELLRKLGIVSVVRVETFDKKVEVPFYRQGLRQDVLMTDDGRIVPNLTPGQFSRFPAAAKKALEQAYNNGRPLTSKTIVIGDTETITVKRYFYHFDKTTFDKMYQREMDHFVKVTKAKQKAMEKAIKTYNEYSELCKG